MSGLLGMRNWREQRLFRTMYMSESSHPHAHYFVVSEGGCFCQS